MKDSRPQKLTHALQSHRSGDVDALDEILPLVYEELHRLAQQQMSRERSEHTLQPTALVHEAYLKLLKSEDSSFESRAHFFGVAARAMRQILVDHARRRAADKRGGGLHRVSLHDDIAADMGTDGVEILSLHAALDTLTELNPPLGRMVELRFFGGLTLDETAEVMSLSRRKVAKDWSFARAWLARELSGAAPQ